MRVHVKFFAIFREMVGVKDEWAEIAEGTTVEQLWQAYASRAKRYGNVRAAFAVNQRLAKPDQVLCDKDEVGFLPPVSGGATSRRAPRRRGAKSITGKSGLRAQRQPRSAKAPVSRPRKPAPDVMITERKLDLAALIKRVESPGAGAILVFLGVVRDNSKGRQVDHLEYEAYPEMAETSMRDIIAEIAERWRDVRVAMAHRTGKIKIGEPSLIIAVSAPHRGEAYAASRYAIERVKAILPVWKKEFASDGEHWVEGPVAGELAPEKADAIVHDAEYSPF